MAERVKAPGRQCWPLSVIPEPREERKASERTHTQFKKKKKRWGKYMKIKAKFVKTEIASHSLSLGKPGSCTLRP